MSLSSGCEVQASNAGGCEVTREEFPTVVDQELSSGSNHIKIYTRHLFDITTPILASQ